MTRFDFRQDGTVDSGNNNPTIDSYWENMRTIADQYKRIEQLQAELCAYRQAPANTTQNDEQVEVSGYMALDGSETPEPWTDVLLLTDDDKPPVVGYSDENGNYWQSVSYRQIHNVSHFAELPELPKVKRWSDWFDGTKKA